jgi:hypothetical protein
LTGQTTDHNTHAQKIARWSLNIQMSVFFFLHLLPSIHPSPNKGKTEWARNPTRRHYFFFFFLKQRSNGFGRDRTERIFQSRQPEGVICSQKKSRIIDKKKKTFEEYGQVFIIIFFFSFYLITLIENISTYFALEWCITAADSYSSIWSSEISVIIYSKRRICKQTRNSKGKSVLLLLIVADCCRFYDYFSIQPEKEREREKDLIVHWRQYKDLTKPRACDLGPFHCTLSQLGRGRQYLLFKYSHFLFTRKTFTLLAMFEWTS